MPPSARGWGSLKGVCREEGRFSITQLHKIKVITINLIFPGSVLLHLLMIFKEKNQNSKNARSTSKMHEVLTLTLLPTYDRPCCQDFG